MQFRISLRCQEPEPVLPVNYQYELSSWIYKVIQNADADYAAFLHQQGHLAGRKSFKLFCFSQLQVPKYEIEGDRLRIKSPVLSFVIGFYLDRTAEEFVRGLFSEQQFRLGDRQTQARLQVQAVEVLPDRLPAGQQVIRVRFLSPLVVARKQEGGHDDYLAPGEPDFAPLFWLNVLEKYRAATGQAAPSWWDASRFGLQVTGRPPRSKLITIKSGTAAQTRVKGWLLDVELDAPRELVEVGLLAGFGRMNAEGFGCGVVVTPGPEWPGRPS